ncbi:hypothetical protein [Colwellia sp. E2M01]|uniref:HvfA family oxazolone/thioamide-modified RiPP metallophore n=1 Tax=Colwellia sp. E2M01 TaxID=2841561 RepID=UPI001C089903|nr:hypothetical protein [Colwellia sp. E2M01]MBU2871327.1 hypothetical protein [Colwellia sp. E2M01]
MNIVKKASISVIASLVALSLFMSSTVTAETNPFVSHEITTVVAVDNNKCGEGKCGEAKMKSSSEAKCGEGKCGEAKMKSSSEAKCGEGKCGEAKMKSSSEAKCGEGKCGESKMKSKKCGE